MAYTIKSGDTLQMIAQRELGDASLWTDIADLNSLTYPFISSVSSVGVASPGDTILLPILDSSIQSQQPTFGTDLALSTDRFNLTSGRGGDLSIGVDGDYKLAVEVESLLQDQAHRMMTPKGTLPYHDDYGSDITTMVGSKKDVNWKIKSELEVSRTIKSDPRISDVSSITVEDIPGGIKVDYTAVASGVIFGSGGVQ